MILITPNSIPGYSIRMGEEAAQESAVTIAGMVLDCLISLSGDQSRSNPREPDPGPYYNTQLSQ